MTVLLARPHAAVTIDGIEVKISRGHVALDSQRVPYAWSEDIEIPMTEDLDLEDMDPSVIRHVIVTAGDEVAGTSRVFNLQLRDRTIVHEDKKVRLVLASDEALVQDYSTLVVDGGARAYESGLRGVINYVLAKVTGNLAPNPVPTPDLTNWIGIAAGSTGATFTTTMPAAGVARVTLTGGAPGWFGLRVAGIPVTPGRSYSARANLRASKSTTLRVNVEWYTAANAYISGGAFSSVAGTEAVLDTDASVAPATAAFANVIIRIYKAEPAGTWVESSYAALAEGESPPAALEPGGPDVNVKAAWPVTNLITNPSAEVNTTGWAAGSGTSAIARITGAVPATPSGVGSFRWTASGAAASFFSANVVIAVQELRPYVFSGYVLSQVARDVRPMIRFVNIAGTILRDVYGPIIQSSTSAWKRFVFAVTAPADAVSATLHIQANPNAAGQFHYADALMFYQGTEEVPYFDGATVDNAEYTFDWTGDTAHASPSLRTPVVERLPELFEWRPGTTAWKFLEPLITSAGLRLFCDELRTWRLVDPATYVVPGFVTASGFNTVNGQDTISRGNPDVFATGVVVRYAWMDENGIARTDYDSAGDPSKVVVFDIASPYPGPGAAAAILARRNGTGRTQAVTAIADWLTTPGMQASITLPEANQQRGKVSAVVFSLEVDALMDLSTRGLIDIPPGSWDAAPPTQTWANVPGTWDTYAGLAKGDDDG